MTEQRFQLAEKLRTYISKYGINDFNEEHLQKVGLTLEELKENFTDRKDIVKAILEHERRCFEEIFNEYNFEGWNAIDIMLITSFPRASSARNRAGSLTRVSVTRTATPRAF